MPVTYLDNAATSFPKPEAVYQKLDQFARLNLANPGRSTHRMASTAHIELDRCRHLLNQLLNGEAAERIIFTMNCTDSLNIAIKGLLVAGDHVVTTNLEHNSVSRPLEALVDAGTITLSRVSADAGGTVQPEMIRAALTPKTKLVVMTHASNVLGTLQQISDVGEIVRRHGALLLIDAAQTVGVVPIDVRAMQLDLVAFPGHKALLGPTGTGALYVGSRAQPHAWREGGTGGDSTSRLQPSQLPYFLEGGTPNVLGVAGLCAGIEFINQQPANHIWQHENELVTRLTEYLKTRKDVTIYGQLDSNKRVGTLSFTHADPSWNSINIANVLDTAFDIAVRPYLHCSPYIHHAMGTIPDGTVRISPGIFNTADDIDHLIEALTQILG